MTHISKNPLKKNTLIKISNQFVEIVSNLKPGKSGGSFLNDFFTDAEKVMLTKRLAVIFMLKNGASYGVIEKTLHISPSTIMRVAKVLSSGGYDGVLAEIQKKKNKEKFLIELEKIFRGGLPEMGRNRWKGLDKL